jgi:tetratricopeptide (TPR) repeat protein
MKKSLLIILVLFVSANVLAGFISHFSPIGLFDLIEKYRPASTEPDLKKATTLIGQKKWDQAIVLLLKFTHENPTSGESWYYLASAYHGKKDYVQAIKANGEAVRHSQKVRANAYYNQACAYALSQNMEKAYASLRMAQQHGFMDYDLLQNDSDLDLLRNAGRIKLPESHEYKKITARNGIHIKYHIIYPDRYEQSKTYPTMLAYPPGSQGKASANWALSELWGEEAKKKGWVIVVPVAPSNGWINHPSHHALNDLLKHVQEKHHIEGGKFHMVGFGSGARPAATFALMSKQYFQSLTTVSSDAWDRWDVEDLASFKSMPVKMIVGENDTHGVAVANRTQKSFKKHQVKSELEIIPHEGRSLPGLRNALLIDKIDVYFRK